MAEKLVQLKKKGGGASGLSIIDMIYAIRYNPETASNSSTVWIYDVSNCKSFELNLTTFSRSKGSPYIEIRAYIGSNRTVLNTIYAGQTGLYTVNNPSQYDTIEIYQSNVMNSNNIQTQGTVTRTY